MRCRRLSRRRASRRSASTPSSGHEQQPGLRAELSGSVQDGRRERVRDVVAARGERRGRHEHRVEAPHLGEDRDRRRTCRREIEERASAAFGTREPDGRDLGSQDERTSDVDARALDERERPGGRPIAPTASVMIRAHSSDVPGATDDPSRSTGHPAASADAVSPPGTLNANGKLLAPKTATGPIGTSIRRRSGCRPRCVGDDRLEVSSGLREFGERAELSRRAGALAHQPRLPERALRIGDPDEVLALRLESVRDRVQQSGDDRGIGPREHGGRVGRRRARARDLVRGRFVEVGRAPAPGSGVDRVERRGPFGALGPRDEVRARDAELTASARRRGSDPRSRSVGPEVVRDVEREHLQIVVELGGRAGADRDGGDLRVRQRELRSGGAQRDAELGTPSRIARARSTTSDGASA